jgi:hypothetical protein
VLERGRFAIRGCFERFGRRGRRNAASVEGPFGGDPSLLEAALILAACTL